MFETCILNLVSVWPILLVGLVSHYLSKRIPKFSLVTLSKYQNISVFLLATLLPCCSWATSLPQNERVPGGVAVVQLPVFGTTMPTVYMNGKHIMVLYRGGHWFAVVGIPLGATAGNKILKVVAGSAAPVVVSFSVAAKVYPEQRLTIRNTELVSPTPVEDQRIKREQRHLSLVFSTWRAIASPDVNFIWPARGPETSPFGVRRILNGEPRSQHSGIDIGAPSGTPVHAPADAVVADVGHYYFCGKTLTLDMGQGLLSVYCHLSRIQVKLDQRVKQGQVIGNVGATGRTTGPNLHWTVRLNDTVVDPHAFLPATLSTPAIITIRPPMSNDRHDR